MKLAPPVIPAQLETEISLAEAFAMAAADGQALTSYAFSGETAAGLSLADADYKGCTFRQCRFTGAEMTDIFFQNVIFDTCDFSGVHAVSASLQKCVFTHCRISGANFSNAGISDVRFVDCHAEDMAFAEALLKNVQFTDCRLSGAVFSDLRPRSVFAFENCALRRAEFLHTTLKGQNLTSCDIDGLALEGPELRGAVVTALQACELAKLLGVIIQ
ncbi:MAG: pentapeptide repeat-containing protein [Ruthenibacterium sp.]